MGPSWGHSGAVLGPLRGLCLGAILGPLGASGEPLLKWNEAWDVRLVPGQKSADLSESLEVLCGLVASYRSVPLSHIAFLSFQNARVVIEKTTRPGRCSRPFCQASSHHIQRCSRRHAKRCSCRHAERCSCRHAEHCSCRHAEPSSSLNADFAFGDHPFGVGVALEHLGCASSPSHGGRAGAAQHIEGIDGRQPPRRHGLCRA